jgi:hypothetical protein
MKGKRDLEGREKVGKIIWKPLGVICRTEREKGGKKRYRNYRMLFSGRFTGVCSLNAYVSELSDCSIFIGEYLLAYEDGT